MPASLRAHVSRVTSSSRPYDRRSPTASPLQSESPLVSPQSLPPTSPIQEDPEIPPDQPGLPTYAEYKRIETAYLHSLSPRKRDKALITQAMFDKIWDVLHQPDVCTIETPQFRFWVRKMFTLSRQPVDGGTEMTDRHPDSDDDDATSLALERAMGIGLASDDLPSAVILHEHRPVAVMEQLYEVFCYCHVRAGHGGRDKTCAMIRRHYSWVPKELTAQFVKACPTCASKRNGSLGVGNLGIGIGVDMGAMVRRGRRGRETVLLGGAEKPEVPLVAGWPTTGGPLDPGNPEPCGVRERLRMREKAGQSSSPVSPEGGRASSAMHEVESCSPGGWRDGSGALTVEVTSFHLPVCDTTHAGLSEAFSADGTTIVSLSPHHDRANNQGPTDSPNRLPSLATALSNDSLDETLAPFVADGGLGERDITEACLPPELKPLRLLGPLTGSDATSPPPHCLFQIDPVLLSFSYPRTELSGGLLSDQGAAFSGPGKGKTESRTVADLNASGIHALAPSSPPESEGRGHHTDATAVRVGGMSIDDVQSRNPGLYSFRSIRSVIRMDSPAPLVDVYPENVIQSLSMERPSDVPLSRSRLGCHGSRYALAMLLPCATDGVGQQLDGTFALSIIDRDTQVLTGDLSEYDTCT